MFITDYSKPVCPSNDCQSKPVGLIKVCLQNPRFVIKTLIFNLFLVLLFFPVYVKLSVVILNIFIDLILFKVILLYNFTCLKTRLNLFISLNGSYLHSMLDTVIIFQSFGIILNVSFFPRLLRIFAIFNITVLNFAKRTSFSNICTDVLILRQNLTTKTCNGLPLVYFLATKPQHYWFCHEHSFILILGLIFITFIICFILRLCIFINVFIQKLTNFSRNVLYILFRILSIFIFYFFVFFVIILLICIFVNLLHVFRKIVNLFIFMFYLHVQLVLMLTKT